MAHHHLRAGGSTCHWGYFDGGLQPVLRIASGDTVTVDTVTGNPQDLPTSGGYRVPPEVHEVHRAMAPKLGPHILTGPVYVEGARPGAVLEVRILDVKLFQDWGYTLILPSLGTLPYEFDAVRYRLIPLDAETMTAAPPWGGTLPLRPFFGVMGVAPPPAWGAISSAPPQPYGGNLDNKDLVAGTTLYLPIHTEGALFSCGDGHGTQGDGEVCITAIETALTGTFQLVVRDDMTLERPRAETPTHLMTMGLDPSLDECARVAVREMIRVITERTSLTREDAYMLCSLAGDLRVTQTVNGVKGVHMMLEKALLPT